jgi:hypothetical protein
MRIFAVLGLALALASPQALQAAEKQCDFQPDIVALSDYVLKNRAGLSRFKRLRYGAISAYLKLRYQKLDEKAAEAMLVPLVQARVARAEELMFAWAINLYGVDTASAMIGPKSAKFLLQQGYSDSVLRAAVVKEGIPALAAQLKDAPPADRLRVESKVPIALLDKFDTYKAELVRQAEASGLTRMAAGLAAIEDDPKAWGDFARRIKDKDQLQHMLDGIYWTPALTGNPLLERKPAVAAKWQKLREQIHQILIAAATMPERDFLTTYLNQTGKDDEVARVAETIRTVAAEKSDGPWTMDRAWLTAYLELLTVSADPAAVDTVLKSITFGGLRHYDGSVRDVLDWMMAADALKAYVLKQSEIKAKPDLISKSFGADWNAWQTAADIIRADGDLGLLQASPKNQEIAAELLFAAGKQHQLAGFITAAKPDDLTVNMAEDFADRMDRICYGYLNFPAEAVVYPDAPLFRFD